MSIKKGNITIASGDGTTNWGGINGDISNQQDLKNVLSSKADVNSPVFYGIPIVPTPEEGTDNLQIANTKFVQNEISKFDALPDQTNNSGKVLSTDGLNPIWVNQSSSNDGKSITLNDNGEIQASGIVNSNNPTEVVTMWIGTKDEYNALPSHSDTCIYNITDDTDSVDVYTKEEVYNKSETYNKNEVYNKNETYSKLETYNKNEIYNKSEINEISKNHLTTSQITNCITEIPQDIKLELVDGTLTLKAGSKVYVPNGEGVFDVVDFQDDTTVNPSNTDGKCFVYLNHTGSPTSYIISNFISGTTAPSSGYIIWYDTSNNIIKRYSGSELQDIGSSLPIAVATVSNGTFMSIDQVFNGFGYIGSTVFALPGVRGLIPNGRNEDGSLKNIEFEVENVLTYTSTNVLNTTHWIITNGSHLDLWDTVNWIGYDEKKNILYNKSTNAQIKYCHVATGLYYSSSSPSNFTPKTTFQAVDRNDSSWLSGLGMPSSRYIDLTLGASGSLYTAPANGFMFFEKVASGVNQYVELVNESSRFWSREHAVSASNRIRAFVYVSKGQGVTVRYTATGNTEAFRFIYAKGEN